MSNTAKEETEAKAGAKEEEGGTAVEENVCANCGAAEVDDIKLEDCTDCDLVKYCSGKCREEHREKHEEHCKKRKAELHDKELFTQPDGTHLGECPLCFLPLPLDKRKYGFYSCCSNMVCRGCVHANLIANEHNVENACSCPFCREPLAEDEEMDEREMERIKACDPEALRQMGAICYDEGDYEGAFKYWTKAAELGDMDAHYELGNMYGDGEGVEKDYEKAVYYYEKAAIGGHPDARFKLALIELGSSNIERSVKHLIIAANLGDEGSMKVLWKYYSKGYISKENLDATLRSHQAAIDSMKSEQREEAELAFPGY